MSKTNLLSILLAATLSLFSLSACQADTAGSKSDDGTPEAKAALASTKPFKHAELKFAMEYPANWNVVEVEPPFLCKMRDPSALANINGSFDKAPADMTHLSFAKDVETLYATKPEVHYKKLSQEEITIDGTKAVKTIQFLGEDPKAKQLSVYFVKDGVAYSVNCTTGETWFPQFEPVFNKVIESVKL